MLNTTFEEMKLSGDLPSPSGIGMKILKLTQGDDFDTDEIGQAIMADSALTGRLLKLANSAQAGSLHPISTVGEATIRLGVRTVRNVALGLSLISANREGHCEGFEYDLYWSRSLARAVAAQAFSARVLIGVPAEAYICGLLSQVGYLALASIYPEEFAQVLASVTSSESKKLCGHENQRFGIDHREIAALMLEDWGLPEDFGRYVRGYEDRRDKIAGATGPFEDLTDVLAAATVLSELLAADDTTPAAKWRELAQTWHKIAARVPGSEEDFASLCNSIGAEWTEWGETLDIPTTKVPNFHELDQIAEEAAQAAKIAAETAAALPANLEPVGQRATPGLSVEEKGDSARESLLGPDGNPIGSNGLRILAVEDDDMSMRMLTRILESEGHSVSTAKNGNEALKIALQTSPQIVIADWVMPEFDGIDLCKALRRIEQGRNMYFLIVTGRDDEKRVVEAFDAGVDDFITKPYNPKLLMARLKGGQRIIRLQEEVADHQKKVRQQAAELGKINRKLRAVALTDVLTQLPNRRYAMKRLDQQWAFCERGDKPLSVILIDIDHFKRVNDEHGHDIGDIVLQETARSMKKQTREEEEPCRLGGEEFLVICGNTPKEHALLAAERMRAASEANIIRVGTFNRSVTLSLGVAELTADMKSPDDLLKAADEAVYAAKHAGRNQICVAGEEPGAWKKSA
ncbi:MAG: diguanylate cyclase [Planctomycetota bacterium]